MPFKNKLCLDCSVEFAPTGTKQVRCAVCTPVRRKFMKGEEYRRKADEIRSKYESNKEQKLQYLREWRENNRDKIRELNRAWYEKNRDSQLLKFKEYGAANKERAAEYLSTHQEQRLKSRKAYTQAKKAVYAAHASKRRAVSSTATPSWANIDRIKEIYIECERITEETGIPHHVDHIVPLRSKLVCGLHVESNLQIITATENVKKGNRFWPDGFSFS